MLGSVLISNFLLSTNYKISEMLLDKSNNQAVQFKSIKSNSILILTIVLASFFLINPPNQLVYNHEETIRLHLDIKENFNSDFVIYSLDFAPSYHLIEPHSGEWRALEELSESDLINTTESSDQVFILVEKEICEGRLTYINNTYYAGSSSYSNLKEINANAFKIIDIFSSNNDYNTKIYFESPKIVVYLLEGNSNDK